MTSAPTPAELVWWYSRAGRCYCCATPAPSGCGCNSCLAEGEIDWICDECLRAEAVAEDALLSLEGP